jgi:hypothetical protein
MSDVDSHPEDGLDLWLATQHDKLVLDVAAILDVEAGLGEVLIPTHHAKVVVDLDRSLAVEAGLAAIVLALQPNEPRTSTRCPAGAEHVAATSPGQAEIILKEFVRAAASWISRTRLAVRTHPVFTLAGFRDRLQALASHLGRGRIGVIAAIVITLVVTTPAPPLSATPLDVRSYGVIAQPRADGVVFTLTVSALGSGTVRYTWRPGDRLSNQPVVTDTITFTGPMRIENVVHRVPLTCSRGQRLQGSMIVDIATPEFPLGATSDEYDVICQ